MWDVLFSIHKNIQAGKTVIDIQFFLNQNIFFFIKKQTSFCNFKHILWKLKW